MALRVLVLGLRGFPDVQGGVERHCEALYPHLVDLGCQVEVITRSRYMKHFAASEYKGVALKKMWSPKWMGLETLLHSFFGICYAAFTRPDVLHIHALGSAFWVPLARLLGLNVIVTIHGPDYQRKKFGRFARWLLRQGEAFSACYAQRVITVAKHIHENVRSRYGYVSDVIANAVTPQAISGDTDVVTSLGLSAKKYFLMVGRIDPDKRQLDLLDAFIKAKIPGWSLAFVGNADFADNYSEKYLLAVSGKENVVSAGFRKGRELNQLYEHAGVFVLPSACEGNPLCVLEAMSFGVPIIASDIPANRELGLAPEHYFPLADVDALQRRLTYFATKAAEIDRERLRAEVESKHCWQDAAAKTYVVYQHSLQTRKQDNDSKDVIKRLYASKAVNRT